MLSVLASISYLYFAVSNTQASLQTNLEKLFILQAKNFSENIKDVIKQKISKDLYEELKQNSLLREELQNSLSMLITPSFKYVYVLYRDKHGKYRYLLDGSREERGDFNQKLHVDTHNWDKIYTTKECNVLIQKDIQNLWGTYLQPILYHDSVEAIIAIDFSAKLPQSISSVMRPIQHIFLYVFISIAMLLLILLYQTIVNARTKKDSFTDELTQTHNRSYLREFLKKMDATKYQILMLDIDYFKKVNDTYGHKAGDYILSEVAHTIRKTLRNNDIIIRFGGEEFLIFIHKDINYEEPSTTIAYRLRESIENREFNYEGTHINITVSIGATLNPENYDNISDAIKKADEMLYIAKESGRNRVVLDS